MSKAKRYPVLDVLEAIRNVLKQDTYIAEIVKNFKRNEPIIHNTSLENITMYDCPAIGVFPPLELSFERSNTYSQQPSSYYIDVVFEASDLVLAQNECLKLCYDIRETLECKANLLGRAGDNRVTKFQELGGFFPKPKIFQFAYRIFLEVTTS